MMPRWFEAGRKGKNKLLEVMKGRQLVSIKKVVDLKRCSVTIDILVLT